MGRRCPRSRVTGSGVIFAQGRREKGCIPPNEGNRYLVELSTKATQDLRGLDRAALEEIHRALDRLEMNPRLPGARSLTTPVHYSIAVGSFRVLYLVDDDARLVTVERIRRRLSRSRRQGASPGLPPSL
jgi:mRNA interferase RelE/StbE